MREKLINYVELLFAGAQDASDIQQEILQNTLDRYDDLVSQGKTPEAAYSLAISGIGDIHELLESCAEQAPEENSPHPDAAPQPTPAWKKTLRAVAVCLYILCPIPLFVLSEIGMSTIGLCGMLGIIGVATALMVFAAGGEKTEKEEEKQLEKTTPQQPLHKVIKSVITTIGLIVYFVISFLTQAWWITWLVFPIMATAQGLVKACFDLKEDGKHEN